MMATSPLREKIDAANTTVRTLLADTHRALTGEREFGPAQILALSAPIQDMAGIAARARDLRLLEPDAATSLDAYAALLRELQTTLEQIHVMLLTQRAQVQTRQAQLDSVAQWASALRQTQ